MYISFIISVTEFVIEFDREYVKGEVGSGCGSGGGSELFILQVGVILRGEGSGGESGCGCKMFNQVRLP